MALVEDNSEEGVVVVVVVEVETLHNKTQVYG